ncbi:MAG: uroporphyrinogen-III synthase [Calditrichaeota bacterium]|nr:uroporphyrinogen-III synthase [Calditrichota bacterium]
MRPLENKQILISRRPEDATFLASILQERGARVTFFNPFVMVPVEGTLRQAIYQTFERWANYDWCILSSANGVRILHQLVNDWGKGSDWLIQIPLAVVGERTAEAVRQQFPQWQPKVKGMALQAVLDELASKEQSPQTVIQLTSDQGVQQVRVRIPEGIVLERQVIYTTRKNTAYSEVELRQLRQTAFDAILFSSPTSFHYFCEIVGEAPLRAGSAIVAFGPTTRRAIEEKGFTVSVVPRQPSPRHLVAALEAFFQTPWQHGTDKPEKRKDEANEA